jgi:hypothetical protein
MPFGLKNCMGSHVGIRLNEVLNGDGVSSVRLLDRDFGEFSSAVEEVGGMSTEDAAPNQLSKLSLDIAAGCSR